MTMCVSTQHFQQNIFWLENKCQYWNILVLAWFGPVWRFMFLKQNISLRVWAMWWQNIKDFQEIISNCSRDFGSYEVSTLKGDTTH